jgi:hypothetical protein
MVVFVTVTNGVRSKEFKVETAAGLIPSVRDVFGEGFIMDPKGVVLTSEYGNLEESVYIWSPGGEKSHYSMIKCHD